MFEIFDAHTGNSGREDDFAHAIFSRNIRKLSLNLIGIQFNVESIDRLHLTKEMSYLTHISVSNIFHKKMWCLFLSVSSTKTSILKIFYFESFHSFFHGCLWTDSSGRIAETVWVEHAQYYIDIVMTCLCASFSNSQIKIMAVLHGTLKRRSKG